MFKSVKAELRLKFLLRLQDTVEAANPKRSKTVCTLN